MLKTHFNNITVYETHEKFIFFHVFQTGYSDWKNVKALFKQTITHTCAFPHIFKPIFKFIQYKHFIFQANFFYFNTKHTTGLQVHSSVETSKQYLQTTNYLTKVYIPQFIMQSSALINVKLFEYEMYRSHTSINFIVLLLTFYILFFRYIFYCIQYDNIHAFRVSIERIMKIVCNGGDIVHGI